MMIVQGLELGLFVLGVHFVILYLFGETNWYNRFKHETWAQPLYSCHLCMTSIWGTIGFILQSKMISFYFIIGFWDMAIQDYLFTLFVSASFNLIIYKIIDKLEI